jgi:hypothetical protein
MRSEMMNWVLWDSMSEYCLNGCARLFAPGPTDMSHSMTICQYNHVWVGGVLIISKECDVCAKVTWVGQTARL